MRYLLILVLALTLFPSRVSGQIINKVPLSERITQYKLDVSLDTAAKTVSGTLEAYWVNNSDDSVPDIQMHLYMNAFRNDLTTFSTESGISPRYGEMDSGWIEINSLKNRKGVDLIPMMRYISPDDANVNDMTVAQIILPEPTPPGDTVFLNINFKTKLPSRIIRTGFNDNFYFVAQWFPKFGVYEKTGMRYAEKGAWNCHQFHANSEFYSNHSVYDVKITLPQRYVVGSGGVLITEEGTLDGLKTLTIRAEDIVDFAWSAWPGYLVHKDQWEHVSITLLIPGSRSGQAERQMTAVKNALEYFSDNVGPYPWPHLTFIDPPSIGSGSGGMEYTTLFTTSSSDITPEFLHMPEMVTVHEFGHAYFMGILASNEFEEPWLDEGINTFWESRIMDHYYGKTTGMIDHPLIKMSNRSYGRIAYTISENRQVADNTFYSWNYPFGIYGMMSYNKASVWLNTLMGIIGVETTNEIFREYYRKWAFRHPSGEDFVNIVNEVVSRDQGEKYGTGMNWFFEQTLYGTGICDYSVAGIENEKYRPPLSKIEADDSSKIRLSVSDSLFTAVARIRRQGEIMLPVGVLIHFTNGDEIVENWDGRSRYKEFRYTGPREIQWVKIDPDFKITMDVNYINNSYSYVPDYIPLRRLVVKLISFIQFILIYITL